MTSAPNTHRVSSRIGVPLRLRLTISALIVLGFVLALILFLAAAFSKQGIFARMAMVALSMSLLGGAMSQAWGAWTLWQSGHWRGLSGEWISRDQQPARFKVWLTMHLLLSFAHLAPAGYLTWAAFGPGF
jgi:hypothetical protein